MKKFTEEHRRHLSEAWKRRAPVSEETKKRMSESSKGGMFSEDHKRKISEAQKGNKNHNYGKKHSEETRKKMSLAHKDRKYKKHSEETKDKIRKKALLRLSNKENHPNWNPNLTDQDRKRKIPGYNKWRISVFEKDNYTCQICGQVGGNLIAHHLESFSNNPELRTTLENGVTTCKICHKDFHHQYGYGNNTRKQFKEFKEILYA